MGAPKIQAFVLKNQWIPLDGWKKDHREMPGFPNALQNVSQNNHNNVVQKLK